MISRLLESSIRQSAIHYPVVTLTGPRQSGKTTLVRSLWPEKAYVSLEDPDSLDFARGDPRAFLEQGGERGLIVDEAQRDPPLFRYLQGYADRSGPGRYILSGSNNFLLMESIGQSLAGRTAVLNLLPFSAEELGPSALGERWEDEALSGFYPRVRVEGLPADLFARDYLATYVERDLRLLKNVSDLSAFRRFLGLCAGRAGSLLNLSSLAGDAGISVNTVKSWLGLLEAAYIVFRLPPWHESLSKRIVKAPKLYWFDTSLLCRSLGLRSAEELRVHPLRGAVFENLIVAERYKAQSHRGLEARLSFWRDSAGREVDLVEGLGEGRRAWEFKSGSTIAQEFFKHLAFFGEQSGIEAGRRILAYGGSGRSRRSTGIALGWREAMLGEAENPAGMI